MSSFHWPSIEKRQRLRKEGIVPVSSFSLLSMTVIVFSIYLLISGESIVELVRMAMEANTTGEIVDDIFPELRRLVLIPVVISALLVTLLGLLQSSFLLNFGLVALHMNRLWKFKFIPGTGEFRRMTALLVTTLFAAGVGGLVVLLTINPLLSLLHQPIEKMTVIMGAGVTKALILFATVFALLLVTAILGARIYFLWEHRMSQEEMRKEAAEA